MDTLQSSSGNINNNNMSIGLLGDGDKMKMQPRDEEEDDYDEDDDDDDEDVNTLPIEGMYDPAEFADLDVTQVLFKMIFLKTHSCLHCAGCQGAV